MYAQILPPAAKIYAKKKKFIKIATNKKMGWVFLVLQIFNRKSFLRQPRTARPNGQQNNTPEAAIPTQSAASRTKSNLEYHFGTRVVLIGPKNTQKQGKHIKAIAFACWCHFYGTVMDKIWPTNPYKHSAPF